DWQDVRIRQVRTGKDLDETLSWVRFSGLAWTRDGRGFFYSRYPARTDAEKLSAPLEHQKVYYHRLGTPQSEDALVYERPDLPTWFVTASVSEDGRYLFVYLAKGADSRNRLSVADLGDPRAPNVTARPIPLVDEDDGEFVAVGNDGPTLYVLTDLDAPRRRVVAVDLARPQRANWRTLIAQGAQTIEGVQLAKSHFVVTRLVDVRSELALYTREGKAAGRVALPAIGTVAGVSATRDFAGFYYAFTSPLYPTTVFRYDVAARTSTPFDPPTSSFDPSRFETTQRFAISKDGTRVPYFVTHRKGMPLDGKNPTLLYAYGGFAVSLLPSFSPANIAWMEQGGVWVTASLRGGGEYGEQWHQAGMREHKQRVFDDFIA
ncbi:MAG TPA: prolyl oligopeptidase family serine peptidase, partial [Gemmatimonadaceae bacterium]|nr:prolyl oligopeptidase family serine peptidase [Gemmatimonadaceae bacterium]